MAHADRTSPGKHEQRGTEWVIRCKRCGFTRIWGQYGIRQGGYSYKRCKLAKCPRCGRICCHTIEKSTRKGASPIIAP